MLMEDVKHEQLLMVTFSRSAVTEFKKRLQKLIGNAAYYIDIKTFHSYCFDLLGKVGTLEKSDHIIQEAINKIQNGEVEPGRITKTVLVIDEAQDMDAIEYALIKVLIEKNEDIRVIAVGDDDQNIYEFRGSSSEYLINLISEKQAVMYELVENFRSKSNLVDFTNKFADRIPHRLKKTLITAYQKDKGKIKLVRYQSSNLITPLVNDILSAELTGTICVLTKTNNEALQITGLLLNNGVQAKLIQSNDGFNLYNLEEIRFFLSWFNSDEEVFTISEEVWAMAEQKLKEKYAGSLNYELCLNLIKDFKAIHSKYKYKSDLEIFIRESKLEDFLGGNSETILVSTMHKAKGREFDHVFLMLDGFNPITDEAKRQLYVAMTRAKQKLTIHYNGNYLDYIRTEGLQIVSDDSNYLPPNELTIQLTYRDVWLDFFDPRQYLIDLLKSGDVLAFHQDECRNSKGLPVIKFSKQFSQRIEELYQKGYLPKIAKVRFIVYWQKEDAENEIRIVLPEVCFERKEEA